MFFFPFGFPLASSLLVSLRVRQSVSGGSPCPFSSVFFFTACLRPGPCVPVHRVLFPLSFLSSFLCSPTRQLWGALDFAFHWFDLPRFLFGRWPAWSAVFWAGFLVFFFFSVAGCLGLSRGPCCLGSCFLFFFLFCLTGGQVTRWVYCLFPSPFFCRSFLGRCDARRGRSFFLLAFSPV